MFQGLLFLMYHPNLDDPLSPLFEGQMDNESFLYNVRRSLRGQDVMGFKFEKMIDDDDDDDKKEGEKGADGEGLFIKDLGEQGATGAISMNSMVDELVHDVLHKVVDEQEQDNNVETGARSMDTVVDGLVQGVLHKVVNEQEQDTAVNGLVQGVLLKVDEKNQSVIVDGLVQVHNEELRTESENVIGKSADTEVQACMVALLDLVTDKVDAELKCSGFKSEEGSVGASCEVVSNKCDYEQNVRNMQPSENEKDSGTNLRDSGENQVLSKTLACYRMCPAEAGNNEHKTDVASDVHAHEDCAVQTDQSGACGGACGGICSIPAGPRHSTEEIRRITQLLDELLTRARLENAEIEAAIQGQSQGWRRGQGEDVSVEDSTEERTEAEVACNDMVNSFVSRHGMQSERTRRLLMEIQTAINYVLPVAEQRNSTPDGNNDDTEALPEPRRTRLPIQFRSDDSDSVRSSPVAPDCSSPIPIPDILEQVEAMLKNIEENGEPDDDIGSDSDTFFTDDEDSFEDIDELSEYGVEQLFDREMQELRSIERQREWADTQRYLNRVIQRNIAEFIGCLLNIDAMFAII